MCKQFSFLIKDLRNYLAGPTSEEGLIALFERHGCVLIEEDYFVWLNDFAHKHSDQTLMDWPAASESVH